MRKPIHIYIFSILCVYTASRAMFVDLMEKNKHVRIYARVHIVHTNIIIYGNENENVHMGWSCK